MYNTYGKENTEEEEVKGINILLSIILAVVTSAVRGTARTPVVHVRCIWYYCGPPPCTCINARTRYYSFLHMDDLCQT
jgi:hypothetical protein